MTELRNRGPGDKGRQREPRVVRVFISSTFLDMREERDELVKHVFPQLRKLCDDRDAIWGEVDLRWGITDEDTAEGKVLPLCLQEIQRCRPYFIGLLGERYGWVPNSIPQALLEREPWLRAHAALSVTELEIIHGVLRNPDMASHAFFYFRDPEYARRVPASHRRDFISDDTVGAVKLKDLKERIRRSGFPVREDYADPHALGTLVLRDLTAVINALFPEGSQPGRFAREMDRHRAFAGSRARVFVDRPALIERLDAHVRESTPPLIVHGDRGSGKSALLAAWSLGTLAECADTLLLTHFVGATPDSVNSEATLTRLTSELSERSELGAFIPQNPYALRDVFHRCLREASRATKIVLVVDGLDRFVNDRGATPLNWLPDSMSPNVRVVVSISDGPVLQDFAKRGWPTLRMEPLSIPERRVFIREYLAQYSKALAPDLVERIASTEQAALPLFLQTLLEELRLHGDHFSLGHYIVYYVAARSPTELYERLLERFERDYEGGRPDLVRDTMSLLWASRNGVSETELLDMLGSDDQPLPRGIFSPLFLAAERSTLDATELVRPVNDDAREAIRKRYLDSEDRQRAVRTRIADYFEARPMDARKAEELPWQLLQCHDWRRLARVLSDIDLFGAMMKNDVRRFEIASYWAAIGNRVDLVETYTGMLDGYKRHDPPGDDVGRIVLEISSLFFNAERTDAAEALIAREMPGFQTSGGNDSLARVICSLAATRTLSGDFESGERLFMRGLALLEAAGSAGPFVTNTECALASVRVHLGKFAEAEAVFENILRLERALAEGDRIFAVLPASLAEDVVGLVASAQVGMARSRAAQGDRRGAEAWYSRAIELMAKGNVRLADMLVGARRSLAKLRAHEGSDTDAEYVSAPRIPAGGSVEIIDRTALSNVLNAVLEYLSQGRHSDAQALLQATLTQVEASLGAAHPWTAEVLTGLAEVYIAEGNPDAATGCLERAMSIDEQAYGTDDDRVARSLFAIGLLQGQRGEHDAAEKSLTRVLEIRRNICRPDDPDLAKSIAALALLYRERGRRAEAAPLLEEAMSLNAYGAVELPKELKLRIDAVEYELEVENLDEASRLLSAAFQYGKGLESDYPGLSTYFVELARHKSKLAGLQQRRRPSTH